MAPAIALAQIVGLTAHPSDRDNYSVERKYQVFVSSTFEDLRDERERLQWEILKAGYIPVGMESFAASNDRGWVTIQRTIDLSDYYVLVIAGRYGSIDPELNMSWTEREYEYAYRQGIPSLVFIRSDEDISLARGELDGAKRERLEAFKTKVKSRHHCSGWGKVESLQAAVLRALSDGIAASAASPRPGWARGGAPATIVPGLTYYHVHLRAEGERSACERGAC